MESATFRKWLAEQGCRFDRHEHQERGEGHVMVTVHREGRTSQAPLGGSRKDSISATCAGSARNSASIGPICLDRRAGCEAPVTIDRPSHHRGGIHLAVQRPDRSFNAYPCSKAYPVCESVCR